MAVVAEESDAEVIGRARQHPDAFAALFDRHYRRIYAYAARRLGAGLADDIAAETFLIAFDRRDGYDRTRADAGPWLYGIAANLIARHARAEARHLRALARTGAVDAVDWDGDAVAGRLDAAAARGLLAQALAALPATEREVLLLVGWAGLSCQDAASALDIPAGTARSRLHRARTQMRAALGMTNSNLDPEVDE
ncbi:RNA polymerase subunit sigma-70 [Actinoplanes sp. ATCC 53533]|uniref:RNA polymerase sigma factor n=1 Tax=Actinoplanes sp. ATCC 53533 TaxID=1288362 RepID=UPI000F777E6B|nr:RNA polymerase sigma factor [Actinoplanes sp. ATCC 53533]RSM64321.1 RNA polymerase subunit sigma-70 [Actinoplanes sp. ATCC 53533]